jgi:hypothetical protein
MPLPGNFSVQIYKHGGLSNFRNCEQRSSAPICQATSQNSRDFPPCLSLFLPHAGDNISVDSPFRKCGAFRQRTGPMGTMPAGLIVLRLP